MDGPAGPATGDAGALLSFLVRAAREQLDARRCTVHLQLPDGTTRPVAHAGAPDPESTDRRPPGGLTLVAANPDRPPIVVPLLVEGRPSGVLEIEHGPGGADREDTVRRVAGLVEAALARAGLAEHGRAERGRIAAERCRRIQTHLTGAVLGGAAPEDVVDLLAEGLRRPVALLDRELRVRTWAAPPVLRLAAAPSLPTAAADLPAVRDLLDGLGPHHPSGVLAPHPPSGLTRRHLLAVLVTEGRVAGYLDVIEMGHALEPAETPLAEQAAGILSLQLLDENRRMRSTVRYRDDVLADLLRGTRAPADLQRLARNAGVDLRDPHLLVRLPVAADRSPTACRDEVTAAVAAVLDAPPPALAGHDDLVLLVALRGDPGPPELHRVRRALRTVLAEVAGHTGVHRAVISGICREVSDFAAASVELREIDGIISALGGRADVIPVTELSTLRLVVNADRAEVAVRFAEQYLGPLRRSDDRGGGDLVETLRHYLESGAQVRATAKALGVHENTVRYRLGRIEHVAGLDVRRFDTLLLAQLAFQVEGLAPAENGPR